MMLRRVTHVSVMISVCLTSPLIADSYHIAQRSDDGTEVDSVLWLEDGVELVHGNPVHCIGRTHDSAYDVGLRYVLTDVTGLEAVAFARLRFSSCGCDIDSATHLVISGVLQSQADTFSQTNRPSQMLPRTLSRITWSVEHWVNPYPDPDTVPWYKVPLQYPSPDISSIVNEFLESVSPAADQPFVLVVEGSSSPEEEDNRVFCEGWKEPPPGGANPTLPVILDLYPTLYDTFLGHELLGRVTDTSVTINLYALVPTDVYVQFGQEPGWYPYATVEHVDNPAAQGFDIELTGLLPDTEYFYRLAYKRTASGTYEYGPEHRFRTQRSRGERFTFTITADEHLQNMMAYPQNHDDMALYRLTLQNLAAAGADLWISLGDFGHPEFRVGRNVINETEAVQRYLDQRRYIDEVAHSLPFFLVLGNHEGEQGWYYDWNTPGENEDSLAVWATRARKAVIPNPRPSAFYTGNTDVVEECGLREDYYAWEWGDALFVVLDPFWYTTRQPARTRDAWDWTLGERQYEWLHETLSGSDAKWKFVFIHHLTSCYRDWNSPRSRYGRGGVEVAKHRVVGHASYEWGGESSDGTLVFEDKRPGWSHGPIHDMLINAGVDIVFHGHDHLFAKQELDGMVYLECPQPGDSEYSYGFMQEGGYACGDILPNSGYVEVNVTEECVRVDYVRSYLPGDGQNGEIAYTFFVGLVGDLDRDGRVSLRDLAKWCSVFADGDRGGDLDGDGDVDTADLFLLLANYGRHVY